MRKFGTFGGVFTPCTLTILGVIMFLRFGYVVGEAGVWYGLLIVLGATAITLLTTLSLSAIATNTRVKGGGAYYLISRSLGVEFGGAIGLVFFLAQAVSVALYVIGFSEAFVGTLPMGGLSVRTVGLIVNVVVFVCVFIGAGWTIRIQYGILAVLGAALASFYLGAFQAFDGAILAANAQPHFSQGQSFFTMFALFFPAVTGIMAGANMSGDLRDPGRSIPRGTLAAVTVTAVIYLSLAVLLAGARPHEVLTGDNLIVADIARWPILITAGVFAATLSSALGSMMGAPRILQAFARDNVFPWLRIFATGSGANSEPRRAIVLTFAVSETCIGLADLDTIAPLITIFFLITYGLINLATFYEAITRNPSYRPRFRYCHWTTSLAGALACLAVMFLIDPVWAGVAIALMAGLHWHIHRKDLEVRWGNVHSGLLFERARRNLLQLELATYHPKNWRPNILAFSGAGWSRTHLAAYGYWFTTGHGVLMLGQVIQGETEDRLERRLNQERILRDFIIDEELEAFPAVIVAADVSDGIESLVQCQGLGAFRPNTVMLGWPKSAERVEDFGATLRTLAGLGRSLLVLRLTDASGDPWAAPPGPIDVWWRGKENGAMMLLLAYLLAKNDAWRSRPIRLLRVIGRKEGEPGVHEHLAELTRLARIHATPKVVISDDPRQAIQETSREAALVFIGFEAPERAEEEAFYRRMEFWAGALPIVVFVHNVGGISLES